MRIRLLGLSVLLLAATALPARASGPHSIGAGIHYWVTTDDIQLDDFDENSFSWLLSYQYTMGFFSLEADLEIFPDQFAEFEDEVLAPQGFLILGTHFYGGLGFGSYYENNDFREEFFVLRLGLDLEFSSVWSIDINANYQFTDFEEIKDVDDNAGGDTITLGVMFRYRF